MFLTYQFFIGSKPIQKFIFTIKKMNRYKYLFLIIMSLSILQLFAQQEVTIIGEMKNVMWKGQLEGNIAIDSITNKKNLYGLGPVEFLAGEILIIDGKAYKSTVVSDSTMLVEETYTIKAPFFGYTNITNWAENNLPKNIKTISELEAYLDKKTKNAVRPFMFKLVGQVDEASIHIVNLPKGSKVSSPDEAHQGQVNYHIYNENVEIIGFFSTAHKTIFTHHDTYLHMHLITKDRKKMGHIDALTLKKGTVKLYLPKE
jgi:acetolactate decarboxylase